MRHFLTYRSQKGVILMNQLKKQLLCLTVLVSAPQLFADGTTSKIVPRSQSFNAARQIVGWDNPNWGIHRKYQDEDYSSFNMIFEYTRTFRGNSLAQALFGNDLVCSGCDDLAINVSGSAVPNRGANDWFADYFGLPRDFQSTVTFKPQIQNYLLEFSYYLGLDGWCQGTYFKIYAPFVHTKWNLNAKECPVSAGTPYNGNYFQGYFSSNVVPTTQMNNSFLSYANGCTPFINNDYDLYGEEYCLTRSQITSCTPLSDITWQSLCCSKISPECGCEGAGLTRNGFGEIRFVLGYDFANDVDGDYHAGIGLYAAAPTGTRVGSQDDCNDKGRYLFEPIVGNGKHWELGAQITAHSIFWRSEDADRSFGLYIEANISHLFGANQIRCFDLCSAGSNSRYMLAQQLASNAHSRPQLEQYTGELPAITLIDAPLLEFANVYAPVANITRSNVRSTIGAQGDVAFSFAYQAGNFQWDLGYNFWGRSCEQLTLKGCCNPGIGQWALKGDQRVFGFANTTGMTYLATALAATDSQANIHTGSNLANNVDYTGSNPTHPTNFYADNSVQALAQDDVNFFNDHPVYILPLSTIPIYTSSEPILIQESDFDLQGTRGISNKIFTHFNYAWPNMNDGKWSPYVGLGFEAEFGSNDKGCNSCDTSCDNPCSSSVCTPACNYGYNADTNATLCNALRPCCPNVALSQWGIWFKVGTSYN
jgi:hypothetical protein